MLQLVYGRSGSGKSEYLMQKLCQSVGQGRRAMLLVPEQISFETEKAVFRRLGAGRMMGVEVLSFTRLGNLIFRAGGGISGQRLDEPTRLVLMSAALDEVAADLELYSQSARGTSFLQLLTQTVAVFKFAGITPEELGRAAAALPAAEAPQLGQKLRELSLIYGAFQALVDRSFSDPLDDLQRASRLAAENGFFADWDIYIDGFMSFTGAQLGLLRVAVEDCAAMTATFCGLPEEAGNQNSLFYSCLQSAAQLEEAARAAFAEVAPPVVLGSGARFAAPGPAAAEAVLCGATPAAEGCEGLHLVSCPHPYDEAEYAAAQISALVRQKGLRYREIAVICRNLDRYRPAVESAFGRYGIPVFLDQVSSLKNHPLVMALLSALEAVRGSWNTQQLLSLAKTPAFGLGVEEAAALENYCYIWSVEGKAWEQDFTASPRGLQKKDDRQEQKREELARLNDTRRRVMEPLSPLRGLARGCTGAEFARGCYLFLQKAGCTQNMQRFCEALPAAEQKPACELCEAVWEKLMGLLDVFVATLGGGVYPLGRLAELLSMTVGLVDVGQIPTTLDQVSFGSADRARPQSPKAVFLLGANEGVFPAAVGQGGIFSEQEYHLLATGGLRLGQPVFQKAQEERFYFYRAAAAASHWLYILAAQSEPTGAALAPAPQFAQLAEALPGAVCAGAVPLARRVVNPATAEEELARRLLPGDPEAASLAEYLRQSGGEEGVQRLLAAEAPQPAGAISPQSAAGLFPKEMQLSASRVEDFYRCAYRYFCRFGLGVEPLRKAEFSPLESGSAIHFVLEQMVRRHGGQPLSGLDSLALHAEVVELLQGYLRDMVADPDLLGARQLYLFNRMVSILVRVLQRLGGEFAQSVFQPAGVEVAVGPQGPVQPMKIEGREGVKISLQGSIDRVDLMEAGQERYARVVDYKSGGKTFNLTEVYYGLNMQMLIYLFALCEGGQGELAGCRPAGILYFPAKTDVQNLPRETDPETAAAKLGGTMTMNGLLLRDEGVLKAMEEALDGRYIPIKRKKDGEYSGSAQLADGEEFAKICRHVKRLIAAMGESLRAGRVAPAPADGTDGTICQYCDYAALCHKSRLRFGGNPELDLKEFYALLDQEEEEEGAK